VESIYYLFVVDDSDSLIGVLTLKHLLIADPNIPVSQLMRKKVVKVRVDTNIKEVARVFYKYNFYIVPVVDKHNKIKGIITMKDALESIFPEMKEESEEKQ
jgi:magnesium transporter